MEKSNTCAQWGIVEPHILADILRSTSGVQKVSKQYLFPFVIFFLLKLLYLKLCTFCFHGMTFFTLFIC